MTKRTFIATLVAIVVILSFLSASLGIAAFARNDTPQNYTLDLSDSATVYDTELQMEFKGQMSTLLGTSTQVLPSVASFIDTVWEALAKARVSAVTVQNLVAELKTADTSDNGEIGLFVNNFFSLAEDSSSTVRNIATEEELFSAVYKILDFMDTIGATADETGRFVYYLVLSYATPSQEAMLVKVSLSDWTLLTVGTYQLLRNTSQGTLISTSIASARAVGQAMVSLGHAYRAISDSVGKDNVARLVGLNLLREIDTSVLDPALVDDYQECADYINAEYATVFGFVSDLLRGQNNLIYEGLYMYDTLTEQGNADADLHLIDSMAELSIVARTNIEKLKSDLGLADDGGVIAYFSEYFARTAYLLDIVYGTHTDKSITAYKADAEAELSRIISCIDTLSLAKTEYEDFEGLKAYKTNAPSSFDLLRAKATELNSINYDYEGTFIKLIYGISVAGIVSAIS